MQPQLLQQLQPAQRKIEQHSIPAFLHLLLCQPWIGALLHGAHKFRSRYLPRFKIIKQGRLFELRILAAKIFNASPKARSVSS